MAFAADSYSLRLKGLVVLTFDTAIITGISNLTFFVDITKAAKVHILARYLKFEDIRFYNFSEYYYNLHDKQKCVITG
jgi:hypothetical protein